MRRLAVLPALLLLALAGCSSEDAQVEAPPAYADNAGEAGAEQFAGYYVDTLNEATDSGETATLRDLSGTSCDACTDFADQLDTIYGKGGRVETDGWEVKTMVPEAGGTDDKVTVLVTVTIPEQKVFATQKAKAKTFDGGNQAFRMSMTRSDGEWQVTDLTPR